MKKILFAIMAFALVGLSASAQRGGNRYDRGASCSPNYGTYDNSCAPARQGTYRNSRGYRNNGGVYRNQGVRARGSVNNARYTNSCRNTRVVRRPHNSHNHVWRVTQGEYWVPGHYVYRRGCQTWVSGRWEWREMRRERCRRDRRGGW